MLLRQSYQAMCRSICWTLIIAFGFVTHSSFGQDKANAFGIRLLDSATGFGVPAKIILLSSKGTTQDFTADSSGRTAINVEPGNYTILISAANFLPMSAAVSINDFNANLQFALDPISPPAEISRKIVAAHRADATIFAGFVSSETTGQPLANVRVASLPTRTETTTDARGFFQIAVPVQSRPDRETSRAKLIFSKDGYGSQERHNLELSPFGDFVLQVGLKSGNGTEIIDEQGRQISSDPTPFTKSTGAVMASDAAADINPTNSTVRLPTNMRVLLTNGTVEYVTMETYVRRSLNDEWISSWGNLASGSGVNSLKAGAVAIRSYAAWHVRNPRGSNHDICATTSCQVYDADSTTITDTAASQTAGYVVLDSNNNIARSEYSAENNSSGFPCGDGYTSPTGSCIYDPACAGETRFGHGRGMCQWGTARWATGFKMAGRSSGDSTPNGFPKQDWIWLVKHYYPALKFVQAKPLVIGDDIKALATSSVRACAGGGIESGTNCPAIASKGAGATGVIIGGPIQVTSDGSGFTWWQIQWSDNVVGWSVENYLDRIVPAPTAPTGLTTSAVSSTQINLNWIDNNDFENGFRIERAPSASGPWLQIVELAANASAFSDTNVTTGNSFYYRARSFNVTGVSGFSNTTNATTPGTPPVLPVIANKSVVEGNLLTFTNFATVTDVVHPLIDFEGFETESPSSAVLFRNPKFSGSTATNIDAAPDYSSVTTLFPTGSGLGNKALFVHCNFTNSTQPWLRLTTASATNLPNPVIDFTQKFQFRIYSDKAIRVGLGLRETTTSAGTPIGFNGGTTGGIEWVGVTNKNGAAPMPSRVVPANVWTTLTFELPSEPVVNFSGGNGVLSTASGLGVLEHLTIVPLAGNGSYKMFFDNFSVQKARTVFYTLASGGPTNATVQSSTGVFNWIPNEAQGPSNYNITLSAMVLGSPGLAALRSFAVNVFESNLPPVIARVSDKKVHLGNSIFVTNSASDPDLPANSLTFDFVTGPSGSSLGAVNGIFSWTPIAIDLGTTNIVSVKVVDNGSPLLSGTNQFKVTVIPRPTLTSATVNNGVIAFNWNAIDENKYRVQFKNDLNDLTWGDLQTITADNITATFSEPIGNSQRFYRLIAE